MPRVMDTRCLIDGNQKKEVLRRTRLNMVPDGPTKKYTDEYYDSAKGEFFELSIGRPDYGMRLRIRNGDSLEFHKDFDALSHHRSMEICRDAAEDLLSGKNPEENESWAAWEIGRLVERCGPMEKRFEISFNRDCYIEKNDGTTVLALDSAIEFNGEPMFNEGVVLLHIISPHTHPMWVVRTLEHIGVHDQKVSLYRTGISKYQTMS